MTNNNNKQLLLHELLKEDQEPFQLTTYLSDRRSLFTKPNTSIQLKNRKPITSNTHLKRTSLCRHACFLSFANSSDVTKSPFPDFNSPAIMSPYKKSPNNAVFIHLTEAAMRIQKQSKPGKNVGFGLFGSFLKKLKERSNSNKTKKRIIGNHDLVKEEKCLEVNQASSSTSSCCSEEMNCDFELVETRFCISPFKFSVHQSPLSNGKRTPDFCSPIGSPCRVANQGEKNEVIQDSNNVQAEEEDKEQCSPVSVLDPLFEDDEHESGDATEESYDLEYGYENVQRAKEQLLYRLRRFEKLAALDPIELERKLLEGSDSESQCEFEESDNDEQLMYANPSKDTNITKERNEVICLGNKEVVLGRICKRLDFSKENKFNTIDMMIELDFKSEFDGWKMFSEQREETMADIEFAIFGLLVEELSEDLYYMD